MDTQVVILAAGKGKRMEQEDIPKVLIPLHGKPIISYLLEEVSHVKGIGKPVIVVGFKHSQVKKALGENYIYTLQSQQLGTAHAVWCAKKQLTAKNIIVLYGDMPFIRSQSIEKLIKLHSAKQAKMSMFTCTVPDFEGKFESLNHFGRIVRDEHGQVMKSVEYKDASPEQKNIREVNPCVYIFQADWLWENIAHINKNNAQGEYYLTDMVELAIEQGTPLYSLSISPKEVFGINTKIHLEQAHTLS